MPSVGPLYVVRCSASSFRSASRPSRLIVFMIKRRGLFLMQPTKTKCCCRKAYSDIKIGLACTDASCTSANQNMFLDCDFVTCNGFKSLPMLQKAALPTPIRQFGDSAADLHRHLAVGAGSRVRTPLRDQLCVPAPLPFVAAA